MKKLVLILLLGMSLISSETKQTNKKVKKPKVVNKYYNFLLTKEKSGVWVGQDITYQPYGVKLQVDCWDNKVKGKKQGSSTTKSYYRYNELEDGKSSYVMTAKHKVPCTTEQNYIPKHNDKLWDNVMTLRTFIVNQEDMKKDKKWKLKR